MIPLWYLMFHVNTSPIIIWAFCPWRWVKCSPGHINEITLFQKFSSSICIYHLKGDIPLSSRLSNSAMMKTQHQCMCSGHVKCSVTINLPIYDIKAETKLSAWIHIPCLTCKMQHYNLWKLDIFYAQTRLD